jgi:protein O-mannosyl-transferase
MRGRRRVSFPHAMTPRRRKPARSTPPKPGRIAPVRAARVAVAPGPRWARPWAHPALGSALVALLLYLPSLGGGFLRDDHFLIERHPYLRAAGWLGRLLVADFWAPVSGATGMWRPLVVLSYWLDGRLAGWTPLWFHAVNAIAHALATAALALLVAGSGAGLAATWLAALAFAAMPAHVECVAWISGRTDVFCALFGLAALWLDDRARRAGRQWPGVLPVLSLALALLSKEVGVPLVGVLAVHEWTRMRLPASSFWRSARWLAPYAAVTALYLVLHGVLAPDPGPLAVADPQSHAALRGAGWSLFPGYVAFLWPWFPHSPDRAAPSIVADRTLEMAFGALALATLVVLLIVLVWRRSRGATPLALILFPLAPPLALASARGYGLFGERHMYVPSAGVVWALALAIPALTERFGSRAGRGIAGGVAALLVLGSAVETLRAIPGYHDDATMYRAMTEREPGNPTGFVGLAATLTERGRLDEAALLLDRAELLDAKMASVHVGRARIAARREAWEVVMGEAERALTLDPHLQSARLLRAVALMRQRRLAEAGKDLEALRDEYPGHPEVGTVWGQYLIAVGRPAEALPVLVRAAELLPGEPSLWDAIGVASARLGRAGEARAAFERVVAITPGYLEGWMRLAAACHRLGDGAGRDRALTGAAALPGGRERVVAFRAMIGGAPR